MKPLYKLFFVLLLSSIAFPSCSSDDDKDKNYSAILTDLKSKSGVIDEVYSESVNTLRDGVVVSEIDFNNAGERMHMFVARVDLDKVTIIASTPNDKPELPNPDAIMPVHAGAAEGNGKTVWLGVNGDFWAGDSSGQLIPMGLFYKDGVAIRTTYYEGHTEVIYKKKDGTVGIGTVNDIFPYLDDMQEVIGTYIPALANVSGTTLAIVYSLVYNGVYMIPEIILTCVVAAVIGGLLMAFGVTSYTSAGMGVFGYTAYINTITNDISGMITSIVLSLVSVAAAFVLTFITYHDEPAKKKG